MASTIILSDNGASSGSAGLKQTAGNDGVLILQTTTSGGTATAGLTINNAQEVAVPAGFSVAAGATENGIIVGGRSDNTSAYRNHMLFYRGNKTGSGIGFGTYGGGSNDATSLVWSNTSAGEGGSLNVNGIGLGSTNAPTSGIGIKFPATQSASSDANTLDDYEEGSWTPSIIQGATSISYTAQVGTYTKIGRFVYCKFQVVGTWTTNGATVWIGGLPFTTGSPGNSWAAPGFFGGDGSSASPIPGLVVTPVGSAYLYGVNTSNGAQVVAQSAGSAKSFEGAFVYIV